MKKVKLNMFEFLKYIQFKIISQICIPAYCYNVGIHEILK